MKGIYLSFILDVELAVVSFFSEFFFRLAKVEGIMSFLQLAAWRTEFVNLFNRYFLVKAKLDLWNTTFVFVFDVLLNLIFKPTYCVAGSHNLRCLTKFIFIIALWWIWINFVKKVSQNTIFYLVPGFWSNNMIPSSIGLSGNAVS